MDRIRILIVDDSVTIRAMMQAVFGTCPTLEVTGLAGSAEEALTMLGRAAPDVVTLDINMPGMGGLALLDLLNVRHFRKPVIMLSSSGADYEGALERGAVACFNKTGLRADAAKLIALVEEAAHGKIIRARHRDEATVLPPVLH